MGYIANPKLPIGERLLPALVDEYARLEPNKLIACIPTTSEMKEWHEVTYSELARAVDNLAWLIESKVGRSEAFETIGYMGINDIRYTVFWLATMKCGFCTLNTSPRNSLKGQVHLLQETSCTNFFHTPEMSQKVHEMKVAVGGLDTFLIPPYEKILAQEVHKLYPFTKSFKELSPKPALIFHTSGTTGLPKPITLVHGYLGCVDNLNVLPVPPGRKPTDWTALHPGDKYFNCMPLFHAAGATFTLHAPIFTGTVFVLQPADLPPSEDTFLKIVKRINLTGAWLPPSFLEELSVSPQSFAELSKLQYIYYGGGPLSQGAGSRLNKTTNIIQNIGGTEMSIVPCLIKTKWQYFEWNPNYGADMDQIGDSDLYEMVIRKNPKYAKYHAVFHTFPDITEWRTRDLFTRDPSDPHNWLFAGRTDDVIVLSNGEKFNPVSMQGHIQDHPLLLAALVIGQGRFQVGLIVEPDYKKWNSERHPQELIDEIWPVVQEANHFSAATGRVFKSKIMVARQDKPFKLAGKGTILRASTINDYSEEIEALYSNIDQDTAVPLPDIITEPSMRAFVRKCLGPYLPDSTVQDEDDLFALGLDSLQTMGFANTLRTAVEPAIQGEKSTEQPSIVQKTVYQNPSIKKMATFLVQLLNGAGAVDHVSGTNGTTAFRELRIAAMVNKYTLDLPDLKHLPRGKQDNLGLIITGTTGSLGAYLLHLALCDPKISKIYCFNRTADGQNRTRTSLREKGLTSLDNHPSKVKFLHVKFGAKQFGLDNGRYHELTQNIDLIIHNAWTVNFNHALESFEDPHIKSIRNFIDLSVASNYNAHIFFVSSVGSIGNWFPLSSSEGDLVPEVVMFDCNVAVPQGYAESKHVSERILAFAAERAGVPCSIARVGQIAGPAMEKGKWNDAEWLPGIVKTSRSIGKIPNALGGMQESGIDWVPVDKMAAACLELAEQRLSTQESKPLDVFHLVNPKTSEWIDLVPTIRNHFETNGSTVEVVNYDIWIGSVQDAVGKEPSEEMARRMPVLPLLDFFKGMKDMGGRSKIATSNTEANSKVLSSLEAISPADMGRWLDQWAY